MYYFKNKKKKKTKQKHLFFISIYLFSINHTKDKQKKIIITQYTINL